DPLLGRRYDLLDSVRAFLLGRLEEAGEVDAARAARLSHFAALAAGSGEMLGDIAGRRLLHLQARNLRLALESAIEHGEDVALAMCEGLTYWWFATDRFSEGRDLCVRALAACSDGKADARALVHR